jgi:predicted RNA-binding Zn-ribbon protein involved in translation (DUF1610 family)
MHLFGGRARQDREHVYATLRSLGPTSVAGLSAALSWSPRRTQRTLRDALRSGDGVALRFDPGTGSVALAAPVLAPPTSVPALRAAAPNAPSPPALPKSWGASPKCATCQVPLVATGTGNGQYCPQCGRLSTASRRAAGPAPPAPPPIAPVFSLRPPAPAVTPPPAVGPSGAPAPSSERRAQEMFAAWVTARPIPCPRCHTPLRHQGVAQYACPACGAHIAFDRSGAAAPPPTSSLSGPSGPSGPTL